MAKWGEGDPRWIVEERPDATNVNNWHWTEKNANAWSKERLNQLLTNFTIEQDGIACVIDEVEQCNGEAVVNNRKGKLIFFYEWELILKWSGSRVNETDNTHKGTVTVPNLSEENCLDEVEITVAINESNEDSEEIKLFMYNVGRDRIRQQLGVYIKELKDDFSKNLILPKKGEENSAEAVKAQVTKKVEKTNFSAINKNPPAAPKSAENSGNRLLGLRSLSVNVEFQCRANDLYNALTKEEMVSAFTRAPATVEAVRGGEFILYNGTVHGHFLELVPDQKIVQTWRLKNWPAGHYSNVIINIMENNNTTQLTLDQTGIPASEYDAMSTNWNRYYWNSIKQTFWFGGSLL